MITVKVYLDNAATSKDKPEETYRAMDYFLRNINCNPGRGGYDLSLEAGRHILQTRETIAELFNVPQSNQVIFTGNVTQALNTALQGLLQTGDHVVTTSLEHNAVIRPLNALKERLGISYTIVQTGAEGFLDPEKVKTAVTGQTRLIVVTHASNVIGTILPIEEIGLIAEEYGLDYVIDAAQTAGCVDIDFQKCRASVLAFTGHKHLLGPMGTGGFCIKKEVAKRVMPLVEGGTGSISQSEYQPEFLPDKFESGTLNAVGIVGLGAGVRYLLSVGIPKVRKKEMELTDRFLQGLEELPGVTVYGPRDAVRQTGTISINLVNMDNAQACFILDQEYGVMARPGLHCAPLAHRTIGTFPQGTLRFSIGHFNTREDIDYTLHCLREITQKNSRL